jgi:hypothetical protein
VNVSKLRPGNVTYIAAEPEYVGRFEPTAADRALLALRAFTDGINARYKALSASGSLIHLHQVVIARPGGLVFPSRRVTLWTKRLGKKAESYEAYRVRVAEDIVLGQAEEIVEFGGERNALEKFRDGQAGDERRGRGMVIALNPNIKHVDLGLWQVPSRWVTKPCVTYDVDMNANTCTCLDHKKRKKKCKHIYAVEYLQSKTSMWQSEHLGKFLSSIDRANNADRQASMAANFGLMYGQDPKALAALISGVGQLGTKSGRLSSSKPNLAGIPRDDKIPNVDDGWVESRIATIVKERMKSLRGVTDVKVTSFIHDEIILEFTQPSMPSAKIPVP